MAHRAVILAYERIQASGTIGVFDLIAPVSFFDDADTNIAPASIGVSIAMATMTGPQIQTAIINAIIELGTSMGYTLAAASNQIIIPQMNRV